MRHIPKAYERYRHFKGNCYQILAIAKDSEDASEQVVYQQLYAPFDIYVRPLSMFMSEVDHEKYPLAKQQYRFELVEGTEPVPEAKADAGRGSGSIAAEAAAGAVIEIAENLVPELTGTEAAEPAKAIAPQGGRGQEAEESDMEGAVDENIMAFLDADTYDQKLRIFSAIHDRVTQEMLNTIAVSLDIEVGSGDLEERYRQIQSCLMTFQKYECNRLR